MKRKNGKRAEAQRKCQMANEVQKAEKKIVITDLAKAIEQMENGKEIAEAISDGLLKAEVAEVKVEAGKFSGDYVKLTLGDNAKTDEQILDMMTLIAGGNFTPPVDDDGEADDRKPSVVKHFFYGADLAARSATSQAVKREAQGPEKAIERMADNIQKAKPGMSREKAVARAIKMLADDDE